MGDRKVWMAKDELTFVRSVRRRYTVKWVSRSCLTYNDQFRRARSNVKKPIDTCFTCGRSFDEGEELDLLGLANVTNEVICRRCSDQVMGKSGEVVFTDDFRSESIEADVEGPKAHDGTLIERGQFWLSTDEECLSFVVGFDPQGYPVLQLWISGDDDKFMTVEKFYKSMFLGRLATREEVVRHESWLGDVI